MKHALGNSYFRTPRTTITSFIDLLTILQENPQVRWEDLIQKLDVAPDRGGDSDKLVGDEDELASFKL